MRVLFSFGVPVDTTNPYLKMLDAAVAAQPDVEVVHFGWREALTGRYDVFHVHWPEIFLEGRDLPRRAFRRTLALLLCLRLLLTRTPVVRTWHNVERPSGLGWFDHRMLDFFDRLTTVRIRLNDHTEMPPDAPYRTVLLGHYRDWFAGLPHAEATPERSSFVGRIRRYKGVEALIEAFRGMDRPAASLEVAGMPSNDELVATLQGLAAGDPRIDLHLEYVDDPSLVRIVTGSALVVLPYRFMHNSSAALAALSLDRPVLVPDNEVNRSLVEEVGPGWVHLYDEEVTPLRLAEVLDEVRTPPSVRPDLDARDWDRAGADHVAAYRQAVELR